METKFSNFPSVCGNSMTSLMHVLSTRGLKNVEIADNNMNASSAQIALVFGRPVECEVQVRRFLNHLETFLS